MNKIYETIKKFALEKSKEGTALGSLVLFLYQLFSNAIMNASINVVGTVFIAVMIGIGHYGIDFILCVTFYTIGVLFGALAKAYQQKRLIENRTLKQSLFAVNGTLRGWSIQLNKCAESIFNSKSKSIREKHRIADGIDFQKAAFTVCDNLCNCLTKYYENDNIYITVFQRQKTLQSDSCLMIAYSGGVIPSSFHDIYEIPLDVSDLLGKIEYHSYLFGDNKTDIAVLPDQKSVSEHFVPHPKRAEREKGIQQYIAVPIAPAGLDVTFILQVDTNIPGLFGKNYEDVLIMAKTAIYPFAQFLHMIYEESRLIEQFIGGRKP